MSPSSQKWSRISISLSPLSYHLFPPPRPLHRNGSCTLWAYDVFLPSTWPSTWLPFRQSPCVFISCQALSKGLQVASQRISKWATSTICLAYQLAHVPVLTPLWPHSTRALAASMAFLKDILLSDICTGATWSQPSTFVTNYHLDFWQKNNASFKWAILSPDTLHPGKSAC